MCAHMYVEVRGGKCHPSLSTLCLETELPSQATLLKIPTQHPGCSSANGVCLSLEFPGAWSRCPLDLRDHHRPWAWEPCICSQGGHCTHKTSCSRNPLVSGPVPQSLDLFPKLSYSNHPSQWKLSTGKEGGLYARAPCLFQCGPSSTGLSAGTVTLLWTLQKHLSFSCTSCVLV